VSEHRAGRGVQDREISRSLAVAGEGEEGVVDVRRGNRGRRADLVHALFQDAPDQVDAAREVVGTRGGRPACDPAMPVDQAERRLGTSTIDTQEHVEPPYGMQSAHL
jgi:hypothetical protein